MGTISLAKFKALDKKKLLLARGHLLRHAQVPRWTIQSAEEMASFPGVLALSRKFERGQLSEGNVARLSQALPPSKNQQVRVGLSCPKMPSNAHFTISWNN